MKNILLIAFVMLIAGCCTYDAQLLGEESNQNKLMYSSSNQQIMLYTKSGTKIGTLKMTKNTRYCKPINDGKKIEYAPVILPPKTSAPTEWEYNDAGWYKNEIQPPEVPDGKVVASITYRYDSEKNAVVADYTYADAPKPIRTFSKLKLFGALTQAGLWDTFEAWLKTQEINGMNAYTAFSLAQDLNDSNELFNGVVESAKVALGVSDEVVESILEASILDM